MAEAEQSAPLTLRQEKILAALQGVVLTWDELRAVTKMSEEGLGFAIGELLDLRKIWTGQRDEVRVYGIERRTGLVPRFGHPQRRAADFQQNVKAP